MPPLAIRTPVENGAADDVDDVVVVDADDSVEEVASTLEDAVSEIDERALPVEDEDIDIDGSETENETETLDLVKGVVDGPVADEEATREEDTTRLGVESLGLGTDVLDTSPELLDTRLDLLIEDDDDDDDDLDENAALTVEFLDDVDKDVVVGIFDKVLDETSDDDLDDDLMTTFEELEGAFDELFDEDLDGVLDGEDEVFIEVCHGLWRCFWSHALCGG
jgi:hypothetical protein